ncbi:T9SS type A sorting domain-containing protein [Myroides sp. WP-1]|nr:T9SS type A sorting domain-containing protein [Myroides sp. WP-1]
MCLAYDLSGNYIGLKNCDAPLSSRSFAMDQFEADSDEEPTRELTLEEMKDFIKVYPNPTDGIFNVVFEEEIHGKIYKVEVFNPNGGLIRSKDLLPGESSTTFNISGYPVGIYILKFTLYTSDFININLIKK